MKNHSFNRSFIKALEDSCNALRTSGAMGPSTLRQHMAAINLVRRALGDRAHAAIGQLGIADFKLIEAALCSFAGGGRSAYASSLLRLLHPLLSRGLNPEAFDLLATMLRQRNEAIVCKPFPCQAIRLILTSVVNEPPPLQGLVYGGLSGGPHLSDLVFLQWTEVRMEAGRIVHTRFKTGSETEYRMLPVFHDWLSQRLMAPGDIYVFQEYVYSEAERTLPACNKVLVKGQARIEAAIARAAAEFADYLKRIGLKEPGYSFKSFRRFAASFWASVDISPPARMKMLGFTSEASLKRYEFPTEWEIASAGMLMQEYLHCILEDNVQAFASKFRQAFRMSS